MPTLTAMKNGLKHVALIMMGIMVTAKNNVSKLLGIGEHAVTIESMEPTEAAPSADYVDKTPQLKVVFKAEDGRQFTTWFNLKGYRSFDKLSAAEQKSGKYINSDGGFAVDKKTRKRIEDADNTAAAMSILGKLAADCGTPEGEEIELESLVGEQVGIHISLNNRNKPRVQYTLPVGDVKATVAEETEA